MSRAADHSPTPAPAPSSAPPANMPAVLNREPSQQDLEIARQLQSFQSQGVPSQETSKPDATSQATPRSLGQILTEGQPQVLPDQASREQQQQQPQQQHSPSPYPPTTQFTPLPPAPQQQRTPQSAATNNGQICSNCGTTKTPLWRRSPTGAVICNACGLYYKARNQMRPVGLKRGAAASTYPSENQPQDRATSPNTMQGGATYVSADQTSNGTCPGGGRCNGTGGHDGCSGCPAYNNRISKTAQVALRQASHGPGQPAQGEGSNQGQAGVQQSVMIACQNCGTTITPLWRRDEAGNTICNACGLYHKLHGHHRPVQMKKAEIKRRKRVVPNNLVNDDHSSVYTAETAEEERRSIPPLTDSHSPNYSHNPDNKQEIRLAGGPIPVDFTDTFRARKRTAEGDSDTVPINPRKRSFSAAAQDHTSEPYAHAQNMAPANDDNIDPALPAQNRAPSSESSRMSDKDKDARRAALQAEADKMLQMLQENQRQLKALNDE